jgi:CheY-like chemotaxis protein
VIVGDEPVFRQVARELLEIRGYAVSGSVRRAAMTSRGALNRLDAAPDLLRRRRLCASHIVSSGAHPIRTMR